MDSHEIDKVVSVDINAEMKQCYINYAMSVIVARALPDVRDGLKPVQRRILYAMNEMNLDPSKGYRKSARIVGETMGKYHPHGDSSIYQAMVRMAQNFSMRYMLVDGHGNFGSIDGYGAAASRYTEARMSHISAEMLTDIEKETVDFEPNYDGNEKEPKVLPARIPNLLINGSSGIAVGMATNIPPHNLGEVIDGVVCLIDNEIEGKETTAEELMRFIKGPDFPTGATILGRSGIKRAYETGRGKISVRAKAVIEPMENGRERIVVTEIPYMVNKLRLIEKIAELVKEKRIEGISYIYDASAGDDIKIIFELKKDANANVTLNKLYKYSQLQDSFSVIMLAIVNQKPEVLNLKDILTHYLNHQKDVITRRARFDLNKAEKRAHILEGLKIAISNIDEIIKIIRTSYDDAKQRLMERFSLSDVQAQAILEMQLRRLQRLESDKIDNEYNELLEKIKYFKSILADEKLLYGVIKDEILAIKDKYADERRTEIINDAGEIDIEDLIDEETTVVTLSNLNYVKRTPLSVYKSQNRGGKGVIGMNTRDEDFVKDLMLCSTRDTILFFTNKGRAYKLKGYELPEASRTSRGVAIVNLLETDADETITAAIPTRSLDEKAYLTMVTKNGVIKRTPLESFVNIRRKGLNAVNIRENDSLISVIKTSGDDEIFVATSSAMGIRFNENDVRAMGRSASGVKAITLREGDYVVSADKLEEDALILNVTEGGYGKKTDKALFRIQTRGGIGLKINSLTEKTGRLAGSVVIKQDEQLMLITSEGSIIRIRANDISQTSRIAQGVKLMNLNEGVKIVGIAKITGDDIYEGEEEQEETEESKAIEESKEESKEE